MASNWIYLAAGGCILAMELLKKLTTSIPPDAFNAQKEEKFVERIKNQKQLYDRINHTKNEKQSSQHDIKQPKHSAINEPDSDNEEHKETELTKEEKEKLEKEAEEANDREEEEKERQKLLKEVADHKKKMKIILYVLLIIDIIINCIMSMIPQQVTKRDNISILSFFKLWRIVYFTSDTYDLFICAFIRIKLLLYLIDITIYFGDIKNYDQDREDHKYFSIKRITKVHQTIAWMVETFIDSHSIENDDLYVHNEAAEKDKASLSDSENDDNESSKLEMKKTFDAEILMTKYDTTDAAEVADFWKTTLWILTFLLLTVFEGYIGLKVVFFDGTHQHTQFYKLMFSMCIAIGHFEVYFAKKYIDDACKPSNQYMNTDVHAHPLFKKKVKGNWCYLCWERRKTGHIYFCHQCHQSVCTQCWKKKKKAKLTGENQLRSDESGTKNDDDVTVYEYFMRNLQFHRAHMQWLAVGLISMLIAAIISVITPKQSGKLLDRIIEGDTYGFYVMVAQSIIFTLVSGVVTTLQTQAMQRVKEEIQCDIQQKLFTALLSQDMAFYDGSSPTDLYRRMEWGLRQMLQPFQGLVRTLLQSSVTLIGSLFMCWNISWRLTLLGMCTLGPMSHLSVLFTQWSRAQRSTQGRIRSEVITMMMGSFNNIKTVRAFAREPLLTKYYSTLRQEQLQKTLKSQYMTSINQTVNTWISLTSKILITWSGGLLILRQQQNIEHLSPFEQIVTIGAFVTFRVYWTQLSQTIQNVRNTINSFDQARFMAKQIFRTLDNEPSIERSSNLKFKQKVDVNEELELKDIEGDIRFENVHFHYQMSPNKKVLKGVDLCIPRGKVTALVGRSGGGKSTMMHLLLRYYDPNEGRISINGVDIKRYNPYSLRNLVSLVAQDNEMFSQSIEYNIAYGVNKYNHKEMEEAATLANAHEFILKFDDGYDTRMGSRGTRVSGGQKQRINIARMLMAKPKLMLLDEATSSLDAESEALVQAALDHAIEEAQCTVVLVAHRLSTVVNADKICVVDDGQIVEEGTHEELIEKDGIYARLVSRQMNLQKKMKEKVVNTKNGKSGAKNDEDYDNIDKLIEQIKKEKEEEKKKKEEENWDCYEDLKLSDDDKEDETMKTNNLQPMHKLETKGPVVDVLLTGPYDADKIKTNRRIPMSDTNETKEEVVTASIVEEVEQNKMNKVDVK